MHRSRNNNGEKKKKKTNTKQEVGMWLEREDGGACACETDKWTLSQTLVA